MDHLQRTERWLGELATLQSTFRKKLEDTVDEIEEPDIRGYFDDILKVARQHEALVENLYPLAIWRG
jgi:hypothetical protein